MKLIRLFALALVSFVCAPAMFAQILSDRLDDTPARVHRDHDGRSFRAGIIDGAKHAEQIPDSAAYRLFFIAVSEVPSPTEKQQARQLAFLRGTGLDESDVLTAIPLLAIFKVQYASLISRYNQAVAAANANATTADVATFLRQRDELVQSTREALRTNLTPDGMARLHEHVQREKTRMKVASKEGL
jgi:hypothetical protein